MGIRSIYLLRHPQPILNFESKIFLGQLDLALSGEGIEQAKRLAIALKTYEVSSIFCSDLIRSYKAAMIIGAYCGLQPTDCEELREINMGEWDGKSINAIKEIYPNEYIDRGRNIDTYRPPGGESFQDVLNRALPVFNNIINSTTGNIVIVGHAGLNRVILAHISSMSLKEIMHIKQDYACINEIIQSDSSLHVKSINDINIHKEHKGE